MALAFKMGSSKQSAVLVITLLLSLSFLLSTAFAASSGIMGGDSFADSGGSSDSSSDSYHYYDHYHHHRDRKSKGSEADAWAAVFTICFVIGFFCWVCCFEAKTNQNSVIMVQVGLTGKATSLLGQLNEIAKTTNTSSSKGWKFILTETTLALLRHHNHFISGYSSVEYNGNVGSVEKSFRQLSMEERLKTDMESLVNVNNVRRQSTIIPKARKFGKNYIVVTILLAAKGIHKVSAIKSIDDLKNVLRCLNFASKKLLAVEVSWTPQVETDALSEEDLLENYPLLRPI